MEKFTAININEEVKSTEDSPNYLPPPTPEAPASAWAKYYTRRWNFALTPIKPHSKEPYLRRWQDYPITDSVEAAERWEQHPDDGMGVVLGPSNMATLDIDQSHLVRKALAAAGIHFDDILKHPETVWIVGKNPKVLYRLPEHLEVELGRKALIWSGKKGSNKDDTIFELRTGANQDLLPPSMHPSGEAYEWRNPPWENGGIPEIPQNLLHLWLHWDQHIEAMKAACPWQEEPPIEIQKATRLYIRHSSSSDTWDSLRNQIRQEKSVDETLADMGAVSQGNNRYLCPFHDEEHPSFWIWDTPEGYHLWCCAHGDAPVGYATGKGYSVGDVIDLYQFQHGLASRTEAMRELAREGGIPCPDAGTPTTDGRRLTDMGNAERLIMQHGADLRYCPPWKCWLIWDGNRWKKDDTHELMRRAKETVRSIYAEAAEIDDDAQRQHRVKHARRSEFRNRLEAMIHLAMSEKGIPLLPDELDTDIWLLNCRNGTLDLRTGTLRSAQRSDRITKQVNVKYEASAVCPQWDAFIHQIMDGDPQRIHFLQKVLGYALTGDTSEQCLFMLIGNGANGKSVLLETVQGILGDDYAKSTPTETIMHRDRQVIPNDLARLTGTRFVTVNEVDEGRRMAESLIKQMTGGDTLSARFLHGEFFDYVPQFKLFIRANHKPTIRGTDHAIWRRIRLVPFEVTIPPEKRDPHLKEKLKEEGLGIFAWMVRGCQQWLKEGLGEIVAGKEATQVYKMEMDIVAQFLDACTEEKPDSAIKASDLYRAYKTWCDRNGEHVLSNTLFGRRLTAYGLRKERRREGNFYVGIELSYDSIDDDFNQAAFGATCG